jgi:glycosyltransferase involved in cell wall biosynthesis
MKVLLFSAVFSPSIGGIETVSASLAEGLTALGCEVAVVTQTAEEDGAQRPYRLFRRPRALQLLKLNRWSDVVFHNGINLRGAWPLLLARRPWVIAHHMWLPRTGKNALGGHIKRLVLRVATKNIAVSSVMATDVGSDCAVIPNPYDSNRFRLLPDVTRHRAIVFVGRLVSDKGVDLLLEALALLRQSGVAPRLTIVGSGPEESALREHTARLQLNAQVEFVGSHTGEALVKLLNAHSVIAIPSMWREPFGLVALEGVACGCIPVVADGGGLTEAIGNCGLVFARGSPSDLAEKLTQALNETEIGDRLRMEAPAHLSRHGREVIAKRYMKALQQAVDQTVRISSEVRYK